MKKFAKLISVMLTVVMVLGAIAVSAEDEVILDAELTLNEFPVFLSVEGPDKNLGVVSDNFVIDETLTAGKVISKLMTENLPELEIAGIEDGYITSVGNMASGTFGGWDGWLFAVHYYAPTADGEIEHYIDIPSVGINEYQIKAPCQIVLYYGDFDLGFASNVITDEGMIKLVEYTAVYDENYTLVSFDETPLAGGSFTFVKLSDENDSDAVEESYTFVADENGMTELDSELRALPNGTYLGFVEKQSETTATVGEETITKPEVVRSSDIYVVDNHPTEEELFKMKLDLLIIGMGRRAIPG